MQKSIQSFFKKSNATSSESSHPVHSKQRDSVDNEIYDETVNNDNDSVNSVNTLNSEESAYMETDKTIVQYRPNKEFKFPQSDIGKRKRRCQYQWFQDFSWLHYDVKKDCVFCFYCLTHESKLTAEHNKDPAYLSTGFRNWKKAPKCFKEHGKCKCHVAALTYETVVPNCGDPNEMHDATIAKGRERERQYLRILMESLQFLARQGIALRGNEDGNDNLTQLLYMRSKDHPWIKERLMEKVAGVKKYTHHDYQDELLEIMGNQVLRRKLYNINNSKMFSLMSDEYTDISNKQQLSLCTRWVDDDLNACEDFLGFYEIPNIKSQTIVTCIKDALTRFNLPLTNLRGQTYDGASNILGKKSGVAAQIKLIQPKAVETHCHGHSLSLSVKDTTKSSRILSDLMGTVAEITTLVKYSPKRENMLDTIKESVEFEDESDDHECIDSLTKLCVTRWTVRATAFQRIMSN